MKRPFNLGLNTGAVPRIGCSSRYTCPFLFNFIFLFMLYTVSGKPNKAVKKKNKPKSLSMRIHMSMLWFNFYYPLFLCVYDNEYKSKGNIGK